MKMLQPWLITLCIACLTSCARQPEIRAGPSYSYYFEEATDSHPMIMMPSGLLEMVFDKKRSDPEALATLTWLKAEVLYPNAKGKITLQGCLDSDRKTFVLHHWYLPRNFVRVQFPENGLEKATKSKRGVLTDDDFRINLKTADPHFHGMKYLQARKYK
ncbi:MAG: hypothetical protein V4662_04025 [Verrucomicrobiota bacterium]